MTGKMSEIIEGLDSLFWVFTCFKTTCIKVQLAGKRKGWYGNGRRIFRMDKSKHLTLQLPDDGRVVIYMKKGECYSVRKLNEDEFIANLKVFFELAQAAGYTVVCPVAKNYNSDRV